MPVAVASVLNGRLGMSRAQWGHGFYKGKIAGISDALLNNTEDGFQSWIHKLRNGEAIAKADWSPECWGQKCIFVRDGQLLMNDHGSIQPYVLTQEDLSCDEWFGIAHDA